MKFFDLDFLDQTFWTTRTTTKTTTTTTIVMGFDTIEINLVFTQFFGFIIFKTFSPGIRFRHKYWLWKFCIAVWDIVWNVAKIKGLVWRAKMYYFLTDWLCLGADCLNLSFRRNNELKPNILNKMKPKILDPKWFTKEIIWWVQNYCK